MYLFFMVFCYMNIPYLSLLGIVWLFCGHLLLTKKCYMEHHSTFMFEHHVLIYMVEDVSRSGLEIAYIFKYSADIAIFPIDTGFFPLALFY